MKKSLLLISLLGVVMTSCAVIDKELMVASPQYRDGQFQNHKPIKTMEWGKIPGLLKRYITEERKDIEPAKPVPLKTIDQFVLSQLPQDSMTLFRLGHSSFLLKADGEYWLIDPVFSERASPFSFIGPKRFHQPPISIEQLPPIKGVIISHNHYDHLDKAAVKQLTDKVDNFIVPLGIGRDLVHWGVKQQNIVEMDWWQSHQIGGVTLTSTPSQHFSGRGVTDTNKTLWSSWVIKTPEQSLYYTGDSGYFPGFKEIGEKFGPFDMTIIETGAYDKDWPDVHMTPEESLQAHIDVKGKKMIPAHNGTFDLAFHAWYEPLERITTLANNAGVDLITPIVGDAVDVQGADQKDTWWRGLN